MSDGWVGYDLDMSLASQPYHMFGGIDHIGKPIPASVNRIKMLLKKGIEVRIFTARASHGQHAIDVVQDWLEDIGLPRLRVTNEKDDALICLYDDRAVQLEPNTGRIIK